MDNTAPKKPWESRTMLVNGILGLVAFVALFVPQASAVKDFLANNAAQITMAWSVLNVVLRAITKDRISLTD